MKDKLTYDELLAENAQMAELLKRQDETLKRQQERIAYLERMLFGSKRDRKVEVPQGPTLFDEMFDKAVLERDAAIEKTAREVESKAEQRRRKAKSQPRRPSQYTYSGLEERRRTVDPEGVDLSQYDRIGADVTRILHREPAKVWVEVIERPVYRHKQDKALPSPRIVQAAAPRSAIGSAHIAGDFLAQMIIDKFEYHIPEYRQVKQYADMGVKLPTSTINGWMHGAADALYPLYECHCEDIRSRGYLQVDEVPVNIADRPGKCRKGYQWQFRDATPSSHGLYFYYHKGSRSGTIPRAQLRGYKGTVQTDGYAVYDYFENMPGVTLLGCMAHVRRKFTEAQASHPQLAAKALSYITLLYELEANLKDEGADHGQIAHERTEKALPVMDAMETWMQAASRQCTPGDLAGKALDYAYKLWPRLRRYALNGMYQIDNNGVERSQRPTVMGRKNYLFCKNDRSAEDNAVFYSLLESCDVVGVNPLQWLTHVFDRMKPDSTEEELKQMLPYYYKKSQE